MKRYMKIVSTSVLCLGHCTYFACFTCMENFPWCFQESNAEVSVPRLTRFNLHGSVLLQSLFRFGNPKLLVSSLLELTPVELKTMACDAYGSHIIDAFVASEQVGEKSKSTLAARLKVTVLLCHFA